MEDIDLSVSRALYPLCPSLLACIRHSCNTAHVYPFKASTPPGLLPDEAFEPLPT